MTDALGPLGRSIEVLRRQIAEHARQLEAGSRIGTSSSSGTPSRAATPARPDIEELRRRIAERMKAIDPQNGNANRRRKRVFLESALAWEFGEDALKDPSFQELVDRLEDALASHPEVEKQLQAAFGPTPKG
jgi:hypothetical protein